MMATAQTRATCPRSRSPVNTATGAAPFEPAATEIEDLLAVLVFLLLGQHRRMQRIDDELALLLVPHQSRVAQHAQVVRDVDQLAAQQSGQLTDVLRPILQALDDL